MKPLLPLLLLLLLHAFFSKPGSFKKEQLMYQRVQAAYAHQQPHLQELLAAHTLSLDNLHILLVGYKSEKELELWAKRKDQPRYSLVKTYPVCATSGILGPKRQSGDQQIPEGLYFIDRFNPRSNFHLSLGLNYPNASDRALSRYPNLGGDIFIHGACVTVGCLPLTDSVAEELYVLAVEARTNGQKHIPVYLFPRRMDELAYQALRRQHLTQPELLYFWDNLKEGWDLFTHSQQELRFRIDTKGTYIFTRPDARKPSSAQQNTAG